MIKSIAVVDYPKYAGCPWRFPGHLLWLKSLTFGGIVVVGQKTYDEMPILLGSSVVSMDRKHPQDIINKYGTDLWIAGGNSTYAQWAPYVQHHYTRQNVDQGETKVYNEKGILLTFD